MDREDFELLLKQSCLVAKADAISRGGRVATLKEEAKAIEATLTSLGLYKSEGDGSVLHRYSQGELTLGSLAEHISSRS